MKWEYDGRKLAPPLTMIRRLTSYPFVMLSRCLLFLSFLAGWGLETAKAAWRDTQ